MRFFRWEPWRWPWMKNPSGSAVCKNRPTMFYLKPLFFLILKLVLNYSNTDNNGNVSPQAAWVWFVFTRRPTGEDIWRCDSAKNLIVNIFFFTGKRTRMGFLKPSNQTSSRWEWWNSFVTGTQPSLRCPGEPWRDVTSQCEFTSDRWVYYITLSRPFY